MFYNMYLPLVSESKDLIIPVYNSTSNISFKIDFGSNKNDFLFKDYSNIETFINKEIEYDLNYFKMNNIKCFEYFSKIVSIIKEDIDFLYLISLSNALLKKEDNEYIFDKIIKNIEVPEIGYSFKNYTPFYKGESFQFYGDHLGLIFERTPPEFENKYIEIVLNNSENKIKIPSLNQAKNCLFSIINKSEISLIKNNINSGFLLI